MGYPVSYSFNILKGQQGQKLSLSSIILAARECENFRRAEEGLNFEIFQNFLMISSSWPIPQIFHTQESCFKHMSKIWDSLVGTQSPTKYLQTNSGQELKACARPNRTYQICFNRTIPKIFQLDSGCTPVLDLPFISRNNSIPCVSP